MGKIVVLVGQSGAGKTTIASELHPEDGYIASCEILRAEVARRGLEDTHENIHTVGMDFQNSDPPWQGARVLEASKDVPFFVFDGPRTPTDIEFLQESSRDVEVVGIYADRKIRYRRIFEREGTPITREHFMTRCIDEVVEAGLNDCLRKANIYLFNNRTSLPAIREYSKTFWTDLKNDRIPQSELYGLSEDDDMETFEGKLRHISFKTTSSPKVCELMRNYFNNEESQLKEYRANKLHIEVFI